MAGAISDGHPAIVQIGDYELHLPAVPGYLLMTRHEDRPGIIGTVGQLLGEADVNISSMQVGRSGPRGNALMLLSVDDPIPPDVVARVSGVIEQKLRGLVGPSRTQRGGLRTVAEIFNCLDRTVSRPTLDQLEAAAPDTASAIRNLMFVFDDLVQLDQNGIRELISRADKKTLTVALKGASEEIRNRFFQNMSKRAADLLREEMEVLGAIRLREVEKAQQEIVAIARKLEEEGLIVTGAASGEAYVV